MKMFILLFLITISVFANDTEKKEVLNAVDEKKEVANAVDEKKEVVNAVDEKKEVANAVDEKKEVANAVDEKKEVVKTSNEKKEILDTSILDGKELKISEEILKYISIDGYFRTRGNFRDNLDLNAFYLMNPNTPDEYIVGSSRHMPTVKELKDGRLSESTVSYDTRFRFSPSIIVGEYLRAVATFDIFDNQQFGDNKSSLLYAKEGYFEGKTPLGMISIGRMATHWALGINRNSGKGKFSNHGDYIDQFQYTLRDFLSVMPHLSVKLAYEVHDSTPKSSSFYRFTRQPDYDIEDTDDYVGFSVYVQDKMEGDELDNYLFKNNTRLNYGLYAGMYWKDYDIAIDETAMIGSKYNYEKYNLDYYTIDGFFEFYLGTKFNIKSEMVYTFGNNEKDESFNQFGIAVQSNLNFLMKTLTVGLDGGIASGDNSSDSNPYKILGKEITYKKDNFIFNLDYDIDLIFFKEIYFISNLYYIRPHISWLATKDISLNLWSVTSIALNKEQTFGQDTYLGTEVDASLEYLNRDGLNFGLRGGVYLPGSGMDWLGIDGKRGGTQVELKDAIADLAFSLQAFLIMKF